MSSKLSNNTISHGALPDKHHAQWMKQEYEATLVSVIVPAYNRGRLISETLDSVWAQTYRPIELNVIDDGSSDNTAQVVKHWKSSHTHDPHFTVRTLTQNNSGAPTARNYGLITSNGEYIQFLDSDDSISSRKIANQVSIMQDDTSLNVVYGPWRPFYSTSNRIEVFELHQQELEGDPLDRWLSGYYVPPNAILWRRSAVVENGPWDDKSFPDDDGEYAMRYFMDHRGNISFCQSGCAFYRKHNKSSERLSRNLKPYMYVADKIHTAVLRKNDIEADKKQAYITAIGNRYYALGYSFLFSQHKLAIECLRKWYILCPNTTPPHQSRIQQIVIRLFGIHAARALHVVRKVLSDLTGEKKPDYTVTDISKLHDAS